MSQVRTQFQAQLEINVGSTKVMQLIVEDPETGEPLSMIDENLFATGDAVITKPDGSIIITTPITYVNRPNGTIEFTIDDTVTTTENAGNWLGKVKFINTLDKIINQESFNFNILC